MNKPKPDSRYEEETRVFDKFFKTTISPRPPSLAEHRHPPLGIRTTASGTSESTVLEGLIQLTLITASAKRQRYQLKPGIKFYNGSIQTTGPELTLVR